MAILQIFDEQLLPWADDSEPRLILAGQITECNDLPPGVLLTQEKLRGPRETLKGPRDLEGIRNAVAHWPQDGMLERDSPLLICVIGGHVDFRAGETKVHCGQGHFLLLPPGVPYDSASQPHYHFDPQKITEDEFCDLLWFGRQGRIIRCWTCHSKGAVHGWKRGEQADFFNEAANRLLELLFDELNQSQYRWQTVCRYYLCAFLTVLSRDLHNSKILHPMHRRALSTSKDGVDARQADPIEEALEYIKSNLRHSLTIEKVAHRCYMSRSQFTKLFRQRTGHSFAQYLAGYRIEEAKMLLRESTWSIKRVAHYVGIRSPFYFTQIFTRATGLTPSQFRHEDGAKTAPRSKESSI